MANKLMYIPIITPSVGYISLIRFDTQLNEPSNQNPVPKVVKQLIRNRNYKILGLV